MIICAGNQEIFEFATSVGIGLIDSTIGLTKICLLNKPENIIFIGSAGSYGKYNIFDIVESRSSSNIELSFLSSDSYTPISNMSQSNNKLTKDQTIVNSSNYITINKEISSKFKELNIGIENMEYHAMLQVANNFKIPIAGIFIITNYTNQDAHKDFINNHKEAMSILVEYLISKNIIQKIKKG